ncbi:MAG TPA: HEAT repeat domain-containing protein [Anaerolineaceae bacterium]|nr:HEAT repeat domain-containing protein [Anaerolineaceae bacterium]
MFANFRFDTFSFILGLISGLFIWFVVVRYKALYPHIQRYVKAYIKKYREISTGGAARYIRQIVLKKSEKSHLASALFPLDDIVIPPRLLSPVLDPDASAGAPGECIAPKILPFFPSWPELASQYNWPYLTLENSLRDKANIAVIGQPGAGKTVALAYLAAKLARKDPSLGDLAEFTPLLFHVFELGNVDTVVDLYEFIVQSFSRQSSFLMKSQITSYLTGEARIGNAIILLDGLDQVQPDSMLKITKLISGVLKKYPTMRFVVSAGPDYLDGLLNIGFHPLTLAAWNYSERELFTRKWGEVWDRSILPQVKKQLDGYEDDHLFLQNWITYEASHLTPLDWTLKIWSFYAGDACGAGTIDSLESFISRTTYQVVNKKALAHLALECNLAPNGVIGRSQAESALSSAFASQEPAVSIPPVPATDQSDVAADPHNASSAKKAEKLGGSASRIISSLAANGLLAPAGDDGITFSHPVFMGYLASLEFAGDLPDLISDNNDPRLDWLLHYLSVQNKAIPVIEDFMNHPDPPFNLNLLKLCRWLKDVPANLEWRSKLMRQIVKIITQPDLADELRAILMSGLTVANDPVVSAMFRQLLLSPDDNLRVLAALGCGAIQDNKSVHEVALLIKDKNPDVRLAACLALGIIRSDAAMQYIHEILLTGEEFLKQAVAESLASRGEEGVELLKESYKSQDLVVRRAVTYGLCFVQDEWPREMLEHIAVEDAQWVVRNSAVQALETMAKPRALVPANLPPPSQSPWLLAFASKQGTGIIPGKIPIDILISALDKGTPEERVAALDYLRLIPNDNNAGIIYRLAFNEQGSIRNSAFMALWFLKVSGARLPL